VKEVKKIGIRMNVGVAAMAVKAVENEGGHGKNSDCSKQTPLYWIGNSGNSLHVFLVLIYKSTSSIVIVKTHQ
jgi:hypothetical protein